MIFDQKDYYTVIKFSESIQYQYIIKTNELTKKIITKEKHNYICDLTDVEFIDSFGIRYFINLKKKVIEKNSSLFLLNVNDRIKEIFSTVKIYEYFNFIDKCEMDEIVNEN